MTLGVGGSAAETELAAIANQRDQATPIPKQEFRQRINKVCQLMQQQGLDALYLDATTSLYYFTGLRSYQSERLHGAVINQRGEIFYVCPAFEKEKTEEAMLLEGGFLLWQEHQDPTAGIIDLLRNNADGRPCRIGVDHQTPFFTVNRFLRAAPHIEIVDAEPLISSCRRIKSSNELALLQHAKNVTLQVHKAAARIMHEQVDTRAVQSFLDSAHIAAGMDGRSTFKIVLFGEPTAYPHGVSYPQNLCQGDMILIDTGATIHGYHSDMTRSYVFGEPTARQREIWDLEKAAQSAAFAAAQIGAPCSAPDDAARAVIEAAGLGPDYQTPGLPHRTGHGVGLDVHEHPYIVRGNDLPLAPGMCFSIEPMICSYGEFGVRLEDHAYITEDGPRWFTEPSESIDDPLSFG